MQTPSNLLPEMSEKFDVVLTQIMKAKNEMGTAVRKDATNPFHKSRYATLGAHLELSETVLFNHGLLMMQSPNILDGHPIIIATIHHPESGQWVKSYLPLPNPKGDSQGVGAAVTYMRRYAINSMLGLNAEDDDGETNAGRGQHAKKEAAEKAKTAPLAPPVAQTVGQSQSKFVESLKTNVVDMQKAANFANPAVNSQQVQHIKSLESKLDKAAKDRLYARLNQVYNINRIEDLPLGEFPKVLTGFENAVKYIEDNQKNSKVQRLEVAHA